MNCMFINMVENQWYTESHAIFFHLYLSKSTSIEKHCCDFHMIMIFVRLYWCFKKFVLLWWLRFMSITRFQLSHILGQIKSLFRRTTCATIRWWSNHINFLRMDVIVWTEFTLFMFLVEICSNSPLIRTSLFSSDAIETWLYLVLSLCGTSPVSYRIWQCPPLSTNCTPRHVTDRHLEELKIRYVTVSMPIISSSFFKNNRCEFLFVGFNSLLLFVLVNWHCTHNLASTGNIQ